MSIKVKKKLSYFGAIGKRKESVALVRLYLVNNKKEVTVDKKSDFKIKKGEIYVNRKKISEYFPLPSQKASYLLPLKVCDSEDRFAISIITKGGGKNGQLDAVVLGLARALEKVDDSYRPILKKNGLLTRDSRIRERRKVGTGGRARRKKQSPKR